jgi:hypothetical protein
MIWLRRLLTIPLVLLFVVLLFITLIVLRVNATFLEPGFYKEELVKGNIYNFLLDDLITSRADELREQVIQKEAASFPDTLEENPLITFSITTEDIVSAVQTSFPSSWVQVQVELALDEVVAYLVGDQDSFEINVQLEERVDIALVEIKHLLLKANFSELLFDQVLDPALRDFLPPLTQLPFGVGISEEEVIAALHQVAPPEWVQWQVEGIIDETGLYLIGKQDTFQAVIPLAERKEMALTVIGDLALTKLEELIAGLPECGIGQLPFSGALPSLGDLPVCVPPGTQPKLLIDALNVDIVPLVESLIGGQIPDSMIYTDVDLVEDLGDNDETLDYVRAALSGGWTYTEVDLQAAAAGDGEVLDSLDSFRSGLSRARRFQYLVYAPLILLLALIAVLAGSRLWSKIAWAAAVLGIASAIAFAASGPVYDIARDRLVDDFRAEQLRDWEGTELLMGEKGLDVLQTFADDFVSGIERSSLTLTIIAIAVFVASQVWGTMSNRSRPPQT